VSKALIITEKPSVARDIAQALGGFAEHEGFFESDAHVLTFAVGHLFELLTPEELDERYKRWTLDALPILPEQLQLKRKKGQTDRIRVIQKLLERDDVDRVVNACDAGREGELIFREIVDFLGSRKPVQRLWLQSMTTEAIREGFRRLRPGEELEGLASAAQCRAWSDWLIGMNATRALTKRLKGRREKTAWSAGRVQTPTLALLVEREIEVLAHVPRPFWRVSAVFALNGHTYTGTFFDPAFRAGDDDALKDDRLFDEAVARAVVEAVRGQPGSAGETRKPSRESAPPLFDLTSLQREGNRRFGWSARRTLDAAQRCYEAHKLLTYPRTDSRCLPNDYRETVGRVLAAFEGATAGPVADYAPHARRLRERGLENQARVFDDSGVSDHFAIIPTGVLPSASLGADDRRLFDLVTRRFLGAFHPPAIWERVERVTTVSSHSFRTRARALTEPGWRAVLPGTGDEEDVAVLPPLRPGADQAEGVAVRTAEVDLEADETRPPPRLSEARLLSLMENAGQSVDDENIAAVMHEKGIGTPATRAEIIENLIAKGYAVRVGKALRPTVKGMRLIDTLHRIHIERLASAALTGELEYHLGEVEHGRRSGADFMSEIRDYAREIVDAAKTFEYDQLYAGEPSLGPCPRCGRPVFEQAWFYRCQQVPGASEEEDCPMRFWKDVSGRYLDRAAVAALLKEGRTPVLDGFTARDGRTYKGVLEVDREQWKVVVRSEGWSGEASSDQPEYEVDPTPLARCPICEEHDVVETPTHFVCAGRLKAEDEPAPSAPAAPPQGPRTGKRADDGRCGLVLPRTVCKREITRAEAEPYVRTGKTELLTDFVSRYGRPFSATLVLKENGRHGFEFPPRVRAGAPAEGTAAEGESKPRAGARRGAGGRSRRATGDETAKPKKTPARKAARRASSPARGAKTPRGRARRGSEGDASS
jgi:DNA topoisomerase-3